MTGHPRHPDETDLVAFALGELAPETHARLEPLIAADPVARREVARIRSLVESMRTDDSTAPTAAAVRRAVDLFRRPQTISPRAALEAWLDRAARTVATLVFDSRAQPSIAGFRGGAAAVQLAWEAGAGRIDVQVSPPAGPMDRGWTIRGQVSGVETPPSGRVVLRRGDETAATDEIDEHGGFRLEATPGDYEILVETDGDDLLVAPNVSVG